MNINRLQWLEAYKTTLEEYEKGTHTLESSACAKCVLAEHNIINSCDNCPETEQNGTGWVFGCLYRSCKACSSFRYRPKSPEIKRNILYHIKAVQWLENEEPKEEVEMESFQMALKLFDEEVYLTIKDK